LKVIFLIRALLGLLNHKTWGPFLETFQASRFDHAISVSWAQAGEDLALINALAGIEKGRYVDVGAHHPSRFSVTRALYERGWTGINIEANFDLIANFERERSRDINLNYCVGNSAEYSFHVFEEPALSTVSIDWKEKFLQEKQIFSETRAVEGIKLSSVVQDFFSDGEFTFLNIDVEGADLEALESLEMSVLRRTLWPKWVMLETAAPVYNALETPAVKYLIDFGYEAYFVLPNATLLRLIES
jgi:FkbM family methyltransferase